MSAFTLQIITRLIYWYQVSLSPDHGLVRALFPAGVCRYQPTCSEYARQAVAHHGWRGLWLSLKRLSRCHPFNIGGYDPPSRRPGHPVQRES